MKNGKFEKYLPVYAHTFVENEDGSYYWASTNLVSAGEKIPVDFNPATSDISPIAAFLLCAVSVFGIAFSAVWIKQYKEAKHLQSLF